MKGAESHACKMFKLNFHIFLTVRRRLPWRNPCSWDTEWRNILEEKSRCHTEKQCL